MCGILALICQSAEFKERYANSFSVGLNEMSHRGPDAQGAMVADSPLGDKTIALGHQRLSIFDLTEQGRQPMVGAAGRTIIFNGEIFNWKELRAELEKLGYVFKSQSDTEVILSAYDAWGPESVKRFNGFWSFVIYDARGKGAGPELFVSRDRLGIKPLYLYRADKVLVFGSEIKPILKSVSADSVICSKALSELLVYDNFSDINQTLYRNVREISPATNIKISLIDFNIKSDVYWRPEEVEVRPIGDAAALEEFKYLIEDSTRLRLRSDVEVALTLSGGIDSSAIAAAVSANRGGNIRAFTSTFGSGSAIDESIYAQQVTQFFQMEHILVDARCAELEADESLLSKHMELLYTSFSQLVNWQVMKEINASNIKVFLNGQGGDEMFMGYERYYAPYLLRPNIPLSDRFQAFYNAAINSRLSFLELAGFLLYFNGSVIRKHKYRHQSRSYLNKLLQDASKNGQPDVLPINMQELTLHETCGAQLRRLLRFDDRICSAFGIEGRPVFLDHRLVEFSIALPVEHKVRNGWTKYIVRKYLEINGLHEVAWRRNKLGFPAPNKQWALNLYHSRNSRLRQSKFLQSVLAPNVDLNKLNYKSLLKILMLESAAHELDWQPLDI